MPKKSLKTSSLKAIDLPEEVIFYITSPYAVEADAQISLDFNFSEQQFKKYLDILDKIIEKKLDFQNLETILKKELKIKNKKKLLKLVKQIVAKRLLILKDWLKGIEDYAHKIGLKEKDYQDYLQKYQKRAEDLKKTIEQEEQEKQELENLWQEYQKFVEEKEKQRQESIKKPIIKPLSPAEQKNQVLEVFKEHVLEVLNASEDYKDKLNKTALFHIFNEDSPAYLRNLETALRMNQERLTKENIKIDQKMVEPTIANWISSFLKSVGTTNLDQLKKAQYMVNSPNVRKLTEEEKQKVSDLLDAYLALKTFPKNFVNTPPEHWQIWPIPQKEAEKLEKYRKLEKTKLPKEKFAKKEIAESTPVSPPSSQVEQESKDLSEQDDEILQKYLGSEEEQKLLAEEEEKIKNKYQNNLDEILKFVYANIKERVVKPESLYAALRLLAKQGYLSNLVNVDSAKETKDFLKKVFMEVLQYNENDAARFVLQLLNFAGISPEDIVYYDQEKKEFKFE